MKLVSFLAACALLAAAAGTAVAETIALSAGNPGRSMTVRANFPWEPGAG